LCWACLNADIRGAISMFSMLPNPESALEALRRDIEPGEWRLRHGSLLDRTALDLGYRLVVA
jgi:hypothetical protein